MNDREHLTELYQRYLCAQLRKDEAQSAAYQADVKAKSNMLRADIDAGLEANIEYRRATVREEAARKAWMEAIGKHNPEATCPG